MHGNILNDPNEINIRLAPPQQAKVFNPSRKTSEIMTFVKLLIFKAYKRSKHTLDGKPRRINRPSPAAVL